MRLLKKFLPQNNFARSVSILFGGTVAAQIVVVLSSLLLTRLYTPEMFGVFAVYTAILSIVGIIGSLRYEVAIPLPEKDQEGARIVNLSMVVLIGMTLITILIIFIFGDYFLMVGNAQSVSDYVYYIPVGMFFSGLYVIFYYWSLRKKYFKDISLTKFQQALSTSIIQVLGFKAGPGALILGQIIGQSIGFLRLGKRFYKSEKISIMQSDILLLASRYRKFPIFSTWDGLLNTASIQLYPIFLSINFGVSYAGFFLLANKVIAMPMTLFAGAFSQVFFSNAAEALRKNELARNVLKLYEILLFISLPPILILMILAPDLFSMFFGEGWAISGNIAQWMSIWILLQFVSSPMSTVFVVTEKQNELLYFQLILFCSRIIAIIYSFEIDDFFLSVMLFSMLSGAAYFLLLVWVFYLSNVSMIRILQVSSKKIIMALISVLPLILYKFALFELQIKYIISLAALTLAVYIIWGLRSLQKELI